MATITKKEIVNHIADTQKVNRAVTKQIVQAFLDQIGNYLAAGNRLEFRDFGVFTVRQRAAHKALNPKTLAAVEVPKSVSIRFKAGRTLKEKLKAHVPGGTKTTGARKTL
ncbi:MAG: integration host factor subunit beta [Planctomycetes bacterium]|nr:integration host factor subunit beta [Planctomycetota bacterium]MDA8378575.1 integration host factor subunit beta [Planctomycetia bacterium]